MMERTTSQSSGYEPLPSSDKAADNAARLAHRATCGIHHLFRELRTGPDGEMRGKERGGRGREAAPIFTLPPHHYPSPLSTLGPAGAELSNE